MRNALPIALLVLPLAAAFALASGESSEANLLPPVGAPDADAVGKVEVSKSGTEQEFKVSTSKLVTGTPPGPFAVFLETGTATGVFNKVDDMSLKSASGGQWLLELKNEGGPPAELGVADVNDVAGRGVQVRAADGTTIYLAGVCPSSSSSNCTASGPALRGKSDLQRLGSSTDDDCNGEIEATKQGKKQEFEVNAKKLDVAGGPYAVFLESGVGTGIFNPLGLMQQKSTSGTWKLEIEGECSPPAALGVQDVTQLNGRFVQVRDASDAVQLQGKCPQLVQGSGQLNFNVKQALLKPQSPPSPKASGSIRSKYNAPQGEQEFEVKAKNLAPGNTYALYLEDPTGSQTFVKIADLVMKGSKTLQTEYEVNTKTGAALPLGATSLLDLKNRALQIRDANDNVHLAGIVP